MSEADSRRRQVAALKSLHAFPVETGGTRSGIPDINLAGGWIECKWMKRWPVHADTRPVKFPHDWTKAQRRFAEKRWALFEPVWLSAQVGQEWFWFSAPAALELWGNMTRPEMREHAILYMKPFDGERLLDFCKQYMTHPLTRPMHG